MGLGSPLQKVAMGMVVVVLFAYFPAHPHPTWEHYDALADPVGWLLVIAGMLTLTRQDDAFSTSRWLAVLAGAVSVPVWFPQLSHQLDASGEWFTSLPQIAFCLLLSREIGLLGATQTPSDRRVAKRFGLLVWGFALVAVLPVLTLGGGLDQLASTTQLVSLLVSVWFIYSLFQVHRRTWLGGPGPLEIQPARKRTQ
jgi:hypothetical protein